MIIRGELEGKGRGGVVRGGWWFIGFLGFLNVDL